MATEGNAVGGKRGIQIPAGRSIKVLIRTQGERFKVLQDDEGRSNGETGADRLS